jgi:hypothetical protein
MEEVQACLPAVLRGSRTTVAKLAEGLSGAGVYRIEAGEAGSFVLKVASQTESIDAWQRNVAIQRSAGEAGLAPRVVHVDEPRRAVVSEFVVDRRRLTRRAVGDRARAARREGPAVSQPW